MQKILCSIFCIFQLKFIINPIKISSVKNFKIYIKIRKSTKMKEFKRYLQK